MASSSSSGEYLADYREGQPPLPCECDGKPPSKLTESWKSSNPAQRFYNCSKSLVRPGECNFFCWIDHELNQHYKDTILNMKLKIDELTRNARLSKQKMNDLQELVSYYKSEKRRVESLKLQEKVIELEDIVSFYESEAATAKVKLFELQVEYNKLVWKCKWYKRIAMICVIAIVMVIMFK